MTTIDCALTQLSDRDLIAEVQRLAVGECQATAALIASLAELDTRRLYLGEGYPSLFAYCTDRLHLSEHATYRRIEAARTARRFPLILERLAAGGLTLTAVGLLAAHLTEENHRAVLDEARHKSKGAVEKLVVRLQSRPDVRTSIRKLPPPRPPASQPAAASDREDREAASPPLLSAEPAASSEGATVPAAQPARRPAVVRPLAPERYQVQMTVSAETHAKLRRAQDLLRHAIPDGDPAAIVDRALTLLLQHLERRTFAARHGRTTAPPAGNRDARRAAPAADRRDACPTAPPADRAARMSPSHARTPTAGTGNRGRVDFASPGPSPSESLDVRRLAEGEEACTGQVPADGVPDVAHAASSAPSSFEHAGPRSRYISAEVRRAVWKRDGGECTFIGAGGRRCGERGLLEFHHRRPYAAGGPATVENLTLRCRGHNGLEAERYFAARPGIEELTCDAQPPDHRRAPTTRAGTSCGAA